MEIISGLLVLLSLIGLALGLITLIRPIRRIGLGSRKRAGIVLAISAVAFITGGMMAPPVSEVPHSSKPVTTVMPLKADESGDRKTPDNSIRLANVDGEEIKRELQPLLGRLTSGVLYPGLPNPKITFCMNDDTLCQMDQLMFIRAWKDAHNGDYGAQRNVAYCLSNGAQVCGGVAQDRIQGCAWRSVIITSADPEMGEGDVSNFETECRRLTETGRIAADAQAARIETIIARKAS